MKPSELLIVIFDKLQNHSQDKPESDAWLKNIIIPEVKRIRADDLLTNGVYCEVVNYSRVRQELTLLLGGLLTVAVISGDNSVPVKDSEYYKLLQEVRSGFYPILMNPCTNNLSVIYEIGNWAIERINANILIDLSHQQGSVKPGAGLMFKPALFPYLDSALLTALVQACQTHSRDIKSIGVSVKYSVVTSHSIIQ